MGYPLLDLTSKTAVVIGGTSGIGLALTKALAQAGADVIPTSRRSELVRSAVAEIEALGRRSLAKTCDVTDESSLTELLDAVCAKFGSMQILVNCAGRTKRAPTLDEPESEWQAILETNLNGTLRACRVFGRHMVQQRYGRIINIASLASFVALYEVAAYCASKYAVIGLTKVAAADYGQQGIRVNSVNPGFVHSEMVDPYVESAPELMKDLVSRHSAMNRLGEASEVAAGVAWLCSDAASFVNGTVLRMDGGETTRLY